jgi:hypothetical protein
LLCAQGVRKISPRRFEVRKQNFELTQDADVLLISFILIMSPNRVIPAQAGTRRFSVFSMFYKAFSHAPACCLDRRDS